MVGCGRARRLTRDRRPRNGSSGPGRITARTVAWRVVAPIDEHHAPGGISSLHVDHFGLCIGPVSVGLPTSGTADDVYRRYLDLLRLIQRGPVDVITPPHDDLLVLADATGNEPDFVARRIGVLQLASAR